MIDEDEDVEGPELSGSAWASCPYCGESVEVLVDPGGGSLQEYVEDCEVCCRPWSVRVSFESSGEATVELEATDLD